MWDFEVEDVSCGVQKIVFSILIDVEVRIGLMCRILKRRAPLVSFVRESNKLYVVFVVYFVIKLSCYTCLYLLKIEIK